MRTAQLTILIGEHRIPIFLQGGFFQTDPGSTLLHKHRYGEIHLVWGGESHYLVGEQRITVSSGQALTVPAETFHECLSAEPGTKITAFQLAYPIEAPLRKTVPCNAAEHLIRQIETEDSPGRIAATIGLICAELFDPPVELNPLRDPAFIIHETLENQYATDLTLEEIAKKLGRSKKQTERLILRYTGKTFRKEVARRRIEAACHLLETEDISLAQAAERVGYKSYSGFWKAFKEQQEKEP